MGFRVLEEYGNDWASNNILQVQLDIPLYNRSFCFLRTHSSQKRKRLGLYSLPDCNNGHKGRRFRSSCKIHSEIAFMLAVGITPVANAHLCIGRAQHLFAMARTRQPG